MAHSPARFLAAAAVALLAVPLARPAQPDDALPAAPEVRALMERVADWQLANPSKHPATDWTQAAGYTGMMALAGISDSPRYLDAMRAMGEKNAWKPGPRIYHADDQCVIQTYAELFLHDHRPEMIAPSVERFDYVLSHPAKGGLEFVGSNRSTQWSWCDSLFMAPPAWVRIWAATGNTKYLEFAVTNWWRTSDFLYDRTEHLFFRDSTYFTKREANGRKVFWSRGNGWVFGGLARILELLPADHPARPRFEQQFREMAAKLITLQQSDGFWRSSLLDPAEYPAKEESGTGFYCYGLAWGINHGLLDRATYLVPMLRAWRGLVSCVEPDGRLIHVQPIGSDPRSFDPNATEPYGVGAFLLAGSEVYRAASAAATPRTPRR
ncbi:MAG TPA: glycoside hydrolase family 88 protein [Opitutaceae bacterium]|nr:glycoside hydrolase family 88 protein [Opitutaceae bacterium]